MARRAPANIKAVLTAKDMTDAERATYTKIKEQIAASMEVDNPESGQKEVAKNIRNPTHRRHLARHYDIYARVDQIDSLTKRLDGELKIANEDEDTKMQTRQDGYEDYKFWAQFSHQLPLLESGLEKVFTSRQEAFADYMASIPFFSVPMKTPYLLLALHGGKRPRINHSYEIIVRYLTVIAYIKQTDVCKSFSQEALKWFCKNRKSFTIERRPKGVNGKVGKELLEETFTTLGITDNVQRIKITQMIMENDKSAREDLRMQLGHSLQITTEQFSRFPIGDLLTTEYQEQIDNEMIEFRKNLEATFKNDMKIMMPGFKSEDVRRAIKLCIENFSYDLVISFEVHIFRLMKTVIPENLREKLRTKDEMKERVQPQWVSEERGKVINNCNAELFEDRQTLFEVDLSRNGEINDPYEKLLQFILLVS